MTKPVCLTLSLGGITIAHYQQVWGEIVSEGKTDKGEDYIMFKDGESEEARRVYKRKIAKIDDRKDPPIES